MGRLFSLTSTHKRIIASISTLAVLAAAACSAAPTVSPGTGDAGSGPPPDPGQGPPAGLDASGGTPPSAEAGGGGPEGGAETSTPSSDSGGYSGTFRHPGVLLNGDQIDFIKAQIALGKEPWTSALAAANADPKSSTSYTPSPPVDTVCAAGGPGKVGDVACGSYSNPDCHCADEKNDAVAGYTDALIATLTPAGDDARAKKAIEIMNAWSASLKTKSLSNTVVQSGWVGTVWARAAELMKYRYTGWATADVAQFSTMLKDVYMPNTVAGAAKQNGNWELSTADATIQMAVFLDDKASFDAGLALWRRRVPAYIYLATDGKPVIVPGTGTVEAGWNGASTFFDGLAQETCRDTSHTQYGFAAMINAAETARIQGVDLYGEEAKRIVTGFELNAGYVLNNTASCAACTITHKSPLVEPTWEIALNHYGNRLGMKATLPNMTALVAQIRPGNETGHHIAWETLTHGDVGSVGIH